MQTFELFIDMRQKVEVQANTIEQAEQIIRQQLEAQPRLPYIWEITRPIEGDIENS